MEIDLRVREALADYLGYHYRYAKTTSTIQIKREAALPFKLAGCAACGEMRLPALEFHHRNPAEKTFEIGTQGYRAEISYYEFVEELEKCIVLCANCHRCHHAGLDIGLSLPRT